MKPTHRLLGLALGALLVAAGCTSTGKPVALPTNVTPTQSATTATTADPGDGGTDEVINDFAKGKVNRTLRTGSVTVKVEYSTPLRIDRWTTAASKPLNVSLTAYVGGKRDQKIYVSRVTVFPSASDNRGELGAADPISDGANIVPGYLVTSPNTYDQRFVLPEFTSTANSLRIDLRYELLLYRGGSNPRDYSKQTATDTLTVPLVP